MKSRSRKMAFQACSLFLIFVFLPWTALASQSAPPLPTLDLSQFSLVSEEIYHKVPDKYSQINASGVLKMHWADEISLRIYLQCLVLESPRILPLAIGQMDELLVMRYGEDDSYEFWRYAFDANWMCDWACYMAVRNGVIETSQSIEVDGQQLEALLMWVLEQVARIAPETPKADISRLEGHITKVLLSPWTSPRLVLESREMPALPLCVPDQGWEWAVREEGGHPCNSYFNWHIALRAHLEPWNVVLSVSFVKDFKTGQIHDWSHPELYITEDRPGYLVGCWRVLYGDNDTGTVSYWLLDVREAGETGLPGIVPESGIFLSWPESKAMYESTEPILQVMLAEWVRRGLTAIGGVM